MKCLMCREKLTWTPLVKDAAICAACSARKLMTTRGSQRNTYKERLSVGICKIRWEKRNDFST